MEILKTVDRKFRANDQRVGKVIKKFEDGLSIEQLEEISSKLKQMTPSELRELHYLRSDLVQNEQTGGKGKPVIVTDLRNMREFYCPSIRECAELLGVEYTKAQLCAKGKIRQIGNYQIRVKDQDDGIVILQGIYRRYMDMLERKKQELVSRDEEDALEREMSDINSEIDRIMNEKET